MPGKPKNQIPSLAKLRRQYPTEAACRAFLEELRWPQGPFCPHCGSYAHWLLNGDSCRPGLKECADCHKQYTVTTKTPLHATRAMVIPEESADDIMAALSPIVAPGSLLVSDKQNSFTAAAADMGLEIETVIHSKREYVRDDVHSGTVDGLGGTLERAKDGVYHRLSRGHLQRYLDEICFRWNCRKRFRELGRSRRWRWVIVLKPLVDQLRTLMRSSIGRRIRRTPNYGFEVVSNQLPTPI